MKNFTNITKLIISISLLLFTGVVQQAKAALLPAGTYTVGPSGNYASISAAISSINSTNSGIAGPIILELNAAYIPVNLVLTEITNASATNTITIRPAASVPVINFSSTGSTPTININAGDFFIIDGRAGGLGTTKGITINNSNTNGSAISFVGDAKSNVITFCTLKGASTSATGGIVVFGNGSSVGNDDNTISFCDITSSSTLAKNGIYSKGQTPARSNNLNIISNCNIYDIFNATAKSVSIFMEANTSGWTIDGNSFYQTTARTSSGVWSAIELNFKSLGGNNFTFSNNFIGGTAPLATGTPMTFTHTGSGYFSGISISGYAPGNVNTISQNIIKNISITCNERNLHYGIYHSDGLVNIAGNTIGDLTTTGSIVFNSSAVTVSGVSPAFSAITAGGGATVGTIGGNVKIQNNNIGSITSNATGGTGANELRGIFYQGSASLGLSTRVDITGNTVGGTIANSIYNNGNGATIGIVINSGYTTGGTKHTIKDNIVQNISSSNSTLIPNGSLEGITTQNGINVNAAYIIENNTIKDLTSNNAFTIVGLKTSAVIATQLITKNKIFNIKNESSLGGSNVVGIELADYTGTTPVAIASELSRNIITNIEMSATTVNPGSVVWGLSANAGRFIFSNNMISMGYGIGNTNITKSYEIIGIANNALGVTKIADFKFYYNTVHVGGTGALAGSPDSKCYLGGNKWPTLLQNNIFYNSRSNAAGGTANHYSFNRVNINGTAGTTTSDYNVLSAVGVGGIAAAYTDIIRDITIPLTDPDTITTFNYTTTDALFAARAIDGNSFSALVKFENSATDLRPVPSPDVTNFFIANEALPIVGFTTDIDGNTRNGYFPDMGCYEFKGTGCWIGQVSSAWDNTAVSGNWDDGVVPPSSWDVKIFPKVDPDLTQPIIINAAGIATVKDLYLRTTTRATTNSSLLTVNTGTLQIYGAVKFRKNAPYISAIDATSGTIDMKGTSEVQTLSPKWFVKTEIETLTNSNTTGLTIAAPTVGDTMLISKTLDYGVGTTGSTITTNDNLTLLSRLDKTANFGNATGNFIVGTVNIERYMFARSAWRLLATPVQIGTSPTVSQAWRESNAAHAATGYGARITGPTGPHGAAGILDDYSIRSSMKSYNSATNNFTDVTNCNTAAIANNKGYYVFVRGDRGAAAVVGLSGITNLRIKGDIRTGDQVFGVPANKFESIGNPYPSRIDMRNVDKTNIVNAFSIWNPNSAGSYNVGAYETYVFNGTNYVNGATIRNFIESGEAFFVQSNVATAGSLTIKETDKGNGSTNVSRPGVTTPTLEISLYAQNANGSSYLADGAMLNFDNSYSAGLDNYDVRKIANTYDNIGIRHSNTNLIVERRPNIVVTDTIKFIISGMRIAPYRIDIDPSVLSYPNLAPVFIDKFLNTETAVSFNSVTTINFSVTADVASRAADRFMIVYRAVNTISLNSISASRNLNNSITVKWAAQNETGLTNYTIEHSLDGINFSPIATQSAIANNGSNVNYVYVDATASNNRNWYRVKANINPSATRYTAVAMVNEVVEPIAIEAEANMNIYPNPVVDGKVNLRFYNQPKGLYTVIVSNRMGQIINRTKVNVQTNAMLQIINLGAASAGIYNATIVDEKGTKNTIAFMVK